MGLSVTLLLLTVNQQIEKLGLGKVLLTNGSFGKLTEFHVNEQKEQKINATDPHNE